jgi:hypothetical protein
MSMLAFETVATREADTRLARPAGVVEIPVLLEPGLLTALESAASQRGITTGALLRCLARHFVCEYALSEPRCIPGCAQVRAFRAATVRERCWESVPPAP